MVPRSNRPGIGILLSVASPPTTVFAHPDYEVRNFFSFSPSLYPVTFSRCCPAFFCRKCSCNSPVSCACAPIMHVHLNSAGLNAAAFSHLAKSIFFLFPPASHRQRATRPGCLPRTLALLGPHLLSSESVVLPAWVLLNFPPAGHRPWAACPGHMPSKEGGRAPLLWPL